MIELLTPGNASQFLDFKHLRPHLADNQGSVQDMIATNATLRQNEWERLDSRVNQVLRERLTVLDDLRGKGLVEPVSIGTIVRRTERVLDFEDAQLNYDGDTSPQEDRVQYEADTIPVPVISSGFRINWRQLAASRMKGEALDVTAAQLAARKVRDRIQALITNGVSAGGPNGGGIPGLTTASNRIAATLAADWDASGGDPIADIEGMLALAYAANLFGPFVLYIPTNYWALVQGDYKTESDRTFLQRFLAYSEIEQVRPLDALAEDVVILVQLTSDVIDYSEAQVVTTVQWNVNQFVSHFRVIAVGGPHIKLSEKSGAAVTTVAGSSNSIHGIIHLS